MCAPWERGIGGGTVNRLQNVVQGLAGTVFILSSLALGGFMFYWFYAWWGVLGVIGGIMLPPLIAVFPFIYLYLEGPSVILFGLWGTGAVAAMIAGIKEL